MRSVKVRPQVESLEGRIALSRAPVLLEAPPRPAVRHLPSPEKQEMLVTVKVALPAGYGWFLEVRGARGGAWKWKGPFGDPAKVRAAFRRKGLRVRSSQLVLPAEPPPEPFVPEPVLRGDVPGFGPDPGPDPGPGPVEPSTLDGFEVEYLNPFGIWTKGIQREIFTSSWDASQRVFERNRDFFPILHRYVPVSLPADQWHILGNRIYPKF